MPKRPSWVKDMHGVIVRSIVWHGVSSCMCGVIVYCIGDEHCALGLEIHQLL